MISINRGRMLQIRRKISEHSTNGNTNGADNMIQIIARAYSVFPTDVRDS